MLTYHIVEDRRFIYDYVFGYFAGLYYWWPKMFGFKLHEGLGKWAFWFWNIGFYICFMPQYVLGLMGMTRRFNAYDFDMGWLPLNIVSTVGAFLMGIAFIFQVWQIAYSIKIHKKETSGDAWGSGRTLEWSIPSPAPVYNFARLPKVSTDDAWWEEKERRAQGINEPEAPLEPIHMPRNSAIPFIMGACWFAAGFGFVWYWYWLAIPSMIGVVICLLARSFTYNTDYYIPVDEIERTEAALRGAK